MPTKCIWQNINQPLHSRKRTYFLSSLLVIIKLIPNHPYKTFTVMYWQKNALTMLVRMSYRSLISSIVALHLWMKRTIFLSPESSNFSIRINYLETITRCSVQRNIIIQLSKHWWNRAMTTSLTVASKIDFNRNFSLWLRVLWDVMKLFIFNNRL